MFDLSVEGLWMQVKPRNWNHKNIYQFIHLEGQLVRHLVSAEFTEFRSKNIVSHVNFDIIGREVECYRNADSKPEQIHKTNHLGKAFDSLSFEVKADYTTNSIV